MLEGLGLLIIFRVLSRRLLAVKLRLENDMFSLHTGMQTHLIHIYYCFLLSVGLEHVNVFNINGLTWTMYSRWCTVLSVNWQVGKRHHKQVFCQYHQQNPLDILCIPQTAS